MRYVPAGLTIALLIALGLFEDPIVVAGITLLLGMFGLSAGITGYRDLIIIVPGLFASGWYDEKGAIVLRYLSPALLQPPVFIEHWKYWRPGVAVFVLLLAVGGIVGYQIKRWVAKFANIKPN